MGASSPSAMGGHWRSDVWGICLWTQAAPLLPPLRVSGETSVDIFLLSVPHMAPRGQPNMSYRDEMS
jgi:hypothetical protein